MAIVADTANWAVSTPIEVSMVRNCVRIVGWLSTTRTSSSCERNISSGAERTQWRALAEDYGIRHVI